VFGYGGMRGGTHQSCGGLADRPPYCEYTAPHHALFLAAGLAFDALAVLLFVLAWRAKTRADRSVTNGV
jgi:uncharacterized protein involved in exopolysaccharide biosynthesis